MNPTPAPMEPAAQEGALVEPVAEQAMMRIEGWNDVNIRARMRLINIFRRAVFKIMVLCKARQKWSEIGAWLNVNRHLRGTGDPTHMMMTSVWNPFGSWIRNHGGFALFSHLKRVKGVLKHA